MDLKKSKFNKMNWKDNPNLEVHDTPEDIPDGTRLYPTGEVYHKPKKVPEKIVAVQRELGKINQERRNPIPTARPTDNGTHDNLVTPGKWKTKSK